MLQSNIPVYKPWLTKLEKKYVNEALDSSWISSTGKFVNKAEELFADFIGTKHCVVTTSGTTALHLCFRALDIQKNKPGGDFRPSLGIVVIPNITFIATAFAASYDQRYIRFVDVDPDTWNINVDHLEEILKQEVIDFVVPVHLYGNPCDMDRLLKLQEKYRFKIIEDACESLGASISGKLTGSLGDVACFSFYGNKSLTCGEGGALVTDDDDLAATARLLRGQAQDPNKRYWHIELGYNYRLTNMQAAILCGQLERADEILDRKDVIAERYQKALGSYFEFQKVLDGHKHSNWLITLKLPVPYEKVAPLMQQRGVDTRKIFYPITEMPYYKSSKDFPISKELSEYGISLPSFPELTNAEIDHVCESLLLAVDSSSN